jgi:3-deoxy-D-manno-octulosonic-acid transferase
VRVRLANKNEPRAWIQAVSVGEANLALLLIPALRQRFPQHRFILTTTTSTGHALARQRLPAGVELLYFPQDFPFTVRRAFDLIQPDFIVLLEAELWPNHIWEAARRQVPGFLVNARMSPKSARRHQRFRWPFCRVWPCLRRIGVQSQPDFEHYLAAGASRDQLELTGNLKYDAALPRAGERVPVPRVGEGRPVLVAGSTWPGEEEILFDLLAKIPGLFLVLVPRHAERTPAIVELAGRKGVTVALRKGEPASGGNCLLVNTTGELKSFYELATVIFVGKSMPGNVGGQNIVEAAASGHPVIFGPHMENFREISRQFLAAGACRQVADAGALHTTVAELLNDPAQRDQMVAAARAVIAANVGATERTVELIARSLR